MVLFLSDKNVLIGLLLCQTEFVFETQIVTS